MSANQSPLSRRALSLDALRGFAILTMVLSGVIPHGILPNWMYHAQTPPPTHQFDASIPGITWVDLVFPFFIFAMGAAFPLAMGRRIEKGIPQWKICLQILERGFLLAAFAVFSSHIRPYSLNPSPNTLTWILAMFGFALLFPMYARLPGKWSAVLRWGIRLGGWGAAALFMYLWQRPDGTGFSLKQRDIIIVILTNVAVFGSFAWLITRKNLLWRLGIIAVIVALRHSTKEAGWIHIMWNYSPSWLSWIYGMGMISYLCVAIPGSILGDMLLHWTKSTVEERKEATGWSNGRLIAMVLLLLVIGLVILSGLQARWVFTATLLTAALCVIGWKVFSNPTGDTESLLKTFFGWGTFWLFLGLMLEPYEGGIKKDPNTLSYFFVTAGLAVFMVIIFMILIDILGKKKWFSILIDNGQNPMIAYMGNSNFILPLMNLTMLGGVIDRMTPGPWLGTLRGMFVTLLVALMVCFFTRRKIFWRT